MSNVSYTRKYIQRARAVLVRSVQVDEDVDGSHQHFGEDENDNNPLKQFTLYRSANVLFQRVADTYVSDGQLIFEDSKQVSNDV